MSTFPGVWQEGSGGINVRCVPRESDHAAGMLSGDPEASRKEAHLSFPGLRKGAGGLAPDSPVLFKLS